MKKVIKTGIILIIALTFVSASFSQQVDPNTKATIFEKSEEAKSITIEELRDQVYFLASDSMKGRETGSEEFIAAAMYCAKQFINAGLTPYENNKSGEVAYFQDVPYRSINYTKGRLPVIEASGKRIKYAQGLNFKISSDGNTPQGDNNLPVVFVGYGVYAPKYGWNDFNDLNIEGKVVLVLNRKPPEELLDKIPLKKRERLMDYRRNISERKAAAIIEIAESEWILQNWTYGNGLKPQAFIVKNLNEKKENSISLSSKLYIKAEMAESIFKDQKYNPNQQITEGKNEYQTFELKGVVLDTADYTNENPVFAPNVVGVIKGSDPKLANEYVVIGAHLDHVGTIYNGADDNASGSVGVIELAEALALNPPKRSVICVLFSGEEKYRGAENGILGSRYFIENSPVPLASVIGMINLDMIGRTAPENKKDRAHYICNVEWTSDYMLRYVEDVNAKTYQWPLKRMISAGSDHSSFAKKGIPSVFFFSGNHADLHKATDDPEKIDYEKMQVITQLVYEVAKKLADEGIIELNNK
jgi:hypothetical protein